MKILIIEDNVQLATSVRDFLVRESYICELAYSYREAEEKIFRFQYDCILLYIMLPDGDGLKLLKLIRSEQLQTNILVTSAKNGLEDKVTGLEEGADDYITKPFHLPELNARIRAINRRKNLNGTPVIEFNEISLNTNTFSVCIYGRPLETTRKEFELLLYFIVNKDRVLSRQSIAAHLWGDYTNDLANFDFVYQHVKNLRKKIGAANGTDYIGTVYGIGYKFNAMQRIEMDVLNRDKKLLPGMVAEITILLPAKDSTFVVPETALINGAEGIFVIRNEQGKADWIAVKKGRAQNGKTEVFGNLADGDSIILHASEEIRRGSALK